MLTLAEYQGLYGSLKNHLKPVVAAGWWSGMRQGEILKLTWDKVDLTKRLIRLKAEDTKEGQPKVVPISKPLRDILLTLPGRAAEGFVFHDLRCGFITYARKAGVPRNVILAITGHSGGKADMNRRYDQGDDADLLKAVDLIEGLFSASLDLPANIPD